MNGTKKLGRRGVVCPNPNCGYRGKGKRKSRGSILVFLLLLLLGIIPGIIYFLVMSGYRLHCPECGTFCRTT